MRTDGEPSGFQVLALMLVAFLLAPIGNGWALSILWGWFVVPVFRVSELSVASAIGLSMTVNTIIRIDYDKNKYNDLPIGEVIANVLGVAMLSPIIGVALGALVRLFV